MIEEIVEEGEEEDADEIEEEEKQVIPPKKVHVEEDNKGILTLKKFIE